MSGETPPSGPSTLAPPLGPNAPLVPASGLATVTDINRPPIREKATKGRPPAGPPLSQDIRKRNADIGELVNIDAKGRGHEPSQVNVSGEKSGGQLISEDNMDVIAANADDIRDNLPRSDIGDLVNIDAKGRGHEPSQVNVSGEKSGGQLISEGNMDVIAANDDFIRDNLPGGEPTPDKTTPDPTTPDKTTPDPTTPDKTTPDPTATDKITPDPTTPDKTTPDPTTPDKTTPDPTTPDKTTPDPTATDKTTPDPTTTEGISDLVNISKGNLDTIAANADFIRDNLPGGEPTPGEITTPEPPTPDGPEPTLEPPTPEEPTPATPDGLDGPESRRDRTIINLDESIVAFARARIALERILGGKNQEAYDAAEAELHGAYNEYVASLAEQLEAGSRELQANIEQLDGDMDAITGRIATTEDAIAAAEPDADIAQMYANIRAFEERHQELADRQADMADEIHDREIEHNEIIAQRVAEVSTRVDAEMLAQRERAHPVLSKINEWLRRHPKTRIVAGVALAASGFVGAATGNMPLFAGALAARAALGAYGAYNASRGFGERRADKRYDAADTSSIEDYTAAAGDQSRTRRRSKKAGAIIGGALAAVPIVRGAMNAADVAPTPKPAPVPETPIPAPAPPELPVTDFRFPWQHMTDQIGSNGTPRILEIANNAPNLGWQVIGNGEGGGSGAILRIIDPVGKVYEGNGPINAALDYLGTKTP